MAKKKKDRVKQPMLYITQPEFDQAAPNMQSVYRTERKPLTKKKEDKPEVETEPKAASETVEASSTQENVTEDKVKRGQQRRRRYSLGLNEPDRSRPAGYDPFLGRRDPFEVAGDHQVSDETEEEIDLQEPKNDEEPPAQLEESGEEEPPRSLQETEEREPELSTADNQEIEERAEKRRVSFTNRNRRSRFKDMSLEDKVDYFVNLPSQVPRMKCEVITEEERYKGWIEEYEDGIVYMKILQRPFKVEVSFDQIQDIVLRGF